ncbi:MAG: hypothetical protein ACT4O1_16565 [Gemmatimonadota bacterium]
MAKVAAVYTATTFVVIQFADVMVPSLNLPATIINIAAVLAVLGFPVTVGIAWALETGGIIGNHESLKSTEPSSSLGNFWLRSAAVVALLTVIAVGVATIKPGSMRIFRQPSLDPASYVVFPLANPAGEERDALEAALYSALTKWTDINVTSPREVRLEKPSALTATVGERADIARAFAARYFISMTVSPAGKQLRVGADLHDVESAARPIRHAEVVISQTELQADTIFARLAATLLFDNSAAALPAGGTASFVARTAFERGLASVREWNLGAADSLFLGAVQSDAEFARAYLWLAQVRYWQKADPAAWSYLISHAVEDSARLSPLDRLSINALNSVVQKDPVACEQLKTVTQQYAHDFAGWFSYATCLFLDDAVVPDAKSPSGFSFRVSHRQAINAYQKALQLMPSIHRGLQGNSFIAVRQALYTSRNRVRSGRAAAPDTGTFSAHPSWQADTLAFVPVRDVDLTKPLSWLKGSEVDEALRRQRRLFYDVAKTWATANPRSPEALEALALGLELLGHPTAADTLRRARELAQTNEQRTQLGTREVLLRLRTSIPDDVRGMTRARVLADSLLAGYDGNAKGRALIASIAALTGRARDAARLYAASESTINVDPAEASMVATAARLLAYSALGGPPDSLAALETIVTRAIDNSLSQRAASNARRQWIVRAALLALPVHRFDSFTKLEDPLPVYAAQRAWLAGNDSVALRILAEREIVRSRVKPWDQTFDILYAEGWLWAKLGHPRKALQWIEPTLTSLEWSSPESLASPVRSGAFLRSLVLRADLAMQTGDKRGAALWSRSVLVLWQNADEFLRPEIERMKRYQSP